MATTRFATTVNALKPGPEKLDPKTATSNIEGWEEYLAKHEQEGVKGVVADLGKLKKLLAHGEPDSAAIGKLLEKLSKDTIKVAEADKSSTSAHIKEIGEALAK